MYEFHQYISTEYILHSKVLLYKVGDRPGCYTDHILASFLVRAGQRSIVPIPATTGSILFLTDSALRKYYLVRLYTVIMASLCFTL